MPFLTRVRLTIRQRRRVVATAALLVAAVLSVHADADRRPERVVAIGDLHGDADAFVALLRLVGLVDEGRHWNGGRATLVQTGDVLDRGVQVREVVDLLMALEAEAAAAGGEAIALMGNHEAMNALGMLRDVSPQVIAQFADAGSEERRTRAFEAHTALADARRAALSSAGPTVPIPSVYAAQAREKWLAAHPPGWIEYLEAFGPEGKYGQWIRERRVAVRVGQTIFLHGGFDPERAPKKLEAVTDQARKELKRWDAMRAWMIEKKIATPTFGFSELVDAGRAELARVAVESRNAEPAVTAGGTTLPAAVARHPLFEMLAVDDWSILGPRGPLWFRGFATWTSDEGRMALDVLQQRFGQVRFVVGHTPLRPPRQMARFGDRIFLIDTGISSVYRADGGRPSALEIRDDTYTAVYLDQRTVLSHGR